MGGLRRRWLIILVLAGLIVAGSFYDHWRKTVPPERPAAHAPAGRQAEVPGPVAQPAAVPAAPGTMPAERAAARAEAGKVSINTAGRSELESLPGIGPVLAERIVEYRRVNGPFRDVRELKRVEGIGEKKFARIKDRIRL